MDRIPDFDKDVLDYFFSIFFRLHNPENNTIQRTRVVVVQIFETRFAFLSQQFQKFFLRIGCFNNQSFTIQIYKNYTNITLLFHFVEFISIFIIKIIWAPISAFHSRYFFPSQIPSAKKNELRSSRGALRKIETFPSDLIFFKVEIKTKFSSTS